MAVQILFRRGTSAEWTSANPTLGSGEPGIETNTGKIKVGDGTTLWNALPYAAGLESLRLQDLSDVAGTAPSTGQVLKWNGTAWAPAADATGGGADGNTTYTVSAETATGGVNLRLTGSDSSTDDVKLTAGSNVTLTRTSASEITIAATGGGGGTDTNTTYSINAVDGTTGKKIIRLTAGGSGSGDDDVVLVAGTNVTLDRTGDEITINSTGGGGGGSMASRNTASATTASIANGATDNIAITGFKSYALLKMEVEHQAWVRIYTDAASRTADASRAEGVDPTPGSGVIAEVITTSAPQTILISPGTIGFNNEGSPTTSIPIAVTNKSGTTRTITVTLTLLQLEA